MVKILKKIGNIIKGWFRKIFGLNQTLADIRLAICNQCPHRVYTSLGYACDQCGCVIDAKTRVEDEYCDLDKW